MGFLGIISFLSLVLMLLLDMYPNVDLSYFNISVALAMLVLKCVCATSSGLLLCIILCRKNKQQVSPLYEEFSANLNEAQTKNTACAVKTIEYFLREAAKKGYGGIYIDSGLELIGPVNRKLLAKTLRNLGFVCENDYYDNRTSSYYVTLKGGGYIYKVNKVEVQHYIDNIKDKELCHTSCQKDEINSVPTLTRS